MVLEYVPAATRRTNRVVGGERLGGRRAGRSESRISVCGAHRLIVSGSAFPPPTTPPWWERGATGAAVPSVDGLRGSIRRARLRYTCFPGAREDERSDGLRVPRRCGRMAELLGQRG